MCSSVLGKKAEKIARDELHQITIKYELMIWIQDKDCSTLDLNQRFGVNVNFMGGKLSLNEIEIKTFNMRSQYSLPIFSPQTNMPG